MDEPTTYAQVPILVYHRIPRDASQRGEWAVPLDDFRAQMAYLARNDIAVCTLDAFLDAYRARRPLARKSVALTFDDGYAATCENVEAVLNQHDYPATLFLATGLIGTRDPLGARDEGALTWERVRALHCLRVEAHTVNHPRLSCLTVNAVRQEVSTCKATIEEILGRAVTHFAYPFGGYTRMVRAAVRDAGYASAYAGHTGPATFQDDRFQFHRIVVDGRDSLDVFARRAETGFLSRQEAAAARARNMLFQIPGVHDLAERRKARRA
jgi:peptidoglycan/xylan/chitin deacetylase (PgdA/CDA1 family)